MQIKALVFDFYDVLGLVPSGWQVEFNQKLADWIKLRRDKYKFGLISNAESSWLKPYLQKHELEFDATVISSEAGMMKPDPRIYRLAIKQLGFDPGSIVFIDDIAEYVEAAKKEGLQGIVYTSNEQLFAELKQLGVE
jgi:epoxide hydrolase-like predicted phosphatase